ncbi:MAG: hypothetical protein ABI665_17580 [Vicinamibacterales bacterium]
MSNTNTDSTNNRTIAFIFGTIVIVWLLVLLFRDGGTMMAGNMMSWWR